MRARGIRSFHGWCPHAPDGRPVVALGNGVISRTQVDRLGDRLRDGAASQDDIRLLDEFRLEFAPRYQWLAAELRSVLSIDVVGRPAKSTTSIIEKLRRETIRLSQMQDVAGCRVVCRDLAEQDDLVRRVADNIPNCEVVDRRKVPSYGYRAVHVLVTVEGRTVELQVRTALQHHWAQVSELLADAFGQELKYGLGDSRFLLYLQIGRAHV